MRLQNRVNTILRQTVFSRPRLSRQRIPGIAMCCLSFITGALTQSGASPDK
jgi:hypothetical protein